MTHTSLSIDDARIILNDYGKLLSEAKPSIYGLPQSVLPHDKALIKSAIQTLLQKGDITEQALRNSLIEAYVFLAHFIPDSDLSVFDETGPRWSEEKPTQNDLEQSQHASRVINTIKLEMEALLAEIELFTTSTRFNEDSPATD